MSLFLQIMAIGIIATIVMTIFSYALSAITNNQFEEPQLINSLFKRSGTCSFKLVREHVLGWAIHFIVGVVFVGCFYALNIFGWFDHSWFSGATFGLLAGIVGALSWGIILKTHPNPPSMNMTGYLLQLIPAHIIFGVTLVSIIRIW